MALYLSTPPGWPALVPSPGWLFLAGLALAVLVSPPVWSRLFPSHPIDPE